MKKLHIRRPVWRGPRLSRKARIVRNLTLSALAAAVLYAALGFPPYTVNGMVDRMARRYLLPDLKPVYVLKDRRHYGSDILPGRRFTYIIARSGEDYLAFQYNTYLWSSELFFSRDPVLAEGAYCAARAGTLYAASPAMSGAATATAAVETKYETFTLEGERLSEEVFGFPYRNGNGPDLYTAVDFAYRKDSYAHTYEGGTVTGYTRVDADLPVTVTLYDEVGKALDTLRLTVSTSEITGWY